MLPSVHLLWIATKSPWPPVDGGRLAQVLTLEALARIGVRSTVVAPAVGEVEEPPEKLAGSIRLETVEIRNRSWLRAGLKSSLTGRPVALLRHDLPAVRQRVAELLDRGRFDAVHVEQLHAWPQAAPARGRGLPCLLRTQNVESDLWSAVGERSRGLRGLLARREGRLLARAEGRVVREASAVVALTSDDGARLSRLAEGREVVAVPPPFPPRLPAAETRLEGDPPLVHLGSGGWWPNRDAETWLMEEVWPQVATRVLGARLHRFGVGTSRYRSGDRIVDHDPPVDSRMAFAPNAVLLVPLRVASGIRMKILEAWARGVPVVATSRAAAGLGADDGRELLLAADGEGFADAVERLTIEEGLRDRLVRGGRQALETRHDPETIAGRLRGLYVEITKSTGLGDTLPSPAGRLGEGERE